MRGYGQGWVTVPAASCVLVVAEMADWPPSSRELLGRSSLGALRPLLCFPMVPAVPLSCGPSPTGAGATPAAPGGAPLRAAPLTDCPPRSPWPPAPNARAASARASVAHGAAPLVSAHSASSPVISTQGRRGRAFARSQKALSSPSCAHRGARPRPLTNRGTNKLRQTPPPALAKSHTPSTGGRQPATLMLSRATVNYFNEGKKKKKAQTWTCEPLLLTPSSGLVLPTAGCDRDENGQTRPLTSAAQWTTPSPSPVVREEWAAERGWGGRGEG